MSKVKIILELDNPTNESVYKYLIELIEDEALSFEVESEE